MNKKICITVSTKEEINQKARKYLIENNIDILYTGIGVPSTILNLMLYLQKNTPLFLINVGIAGAYNKSIKIGDVGIVTSDVFADFLLMYNKNEFKHISDVFRIYSLIQNTTDINIGLKKFKAVTVNSLVYSKKIREFCKKKFNPDIETMEGAAFMFVCKYFNVPHICIRSISNYVGEIDRSKWNVKLAVNNLSSVLINIININLWRKKNI